MRLKIALIGSRGYPAVYSGYETFVQELSERLTRKGHRMTVYNHRGLFAKRPPVVRGIRLVYVPSIEKKYLSQFSHSFLSLIHACLHDFDLLFVLNSANGPLGVIPRLFRKKTALHIDGLEWLRPKWKGLGSGYFYWASKMSARLFGTLVTDSWAMREIIIREFGRAPAVIAYGAEVRKALPPESIRKRGLSPRGYYLIVGRLIPDNNADHIIAEFRKSHSRRKLVVVGDDPYRGRYAETLKSLPDSRLMFTGTVRDSGELAELYQHCQAYLHGHEFGGTNPSLLQALGYGCSVCALDTVFNREVLKDGEYGILFTKQEDDLKAKIEEMERRPEILDPLREKAPSRILENYTWEKITNQYNELFQRIAKER